MFKTLISAAITTLVIASGASAGEGWATRDLNIRSGPGTDYYVVTSMPTCGKMQVYESENGWYRVNWKGNEGWVSARYVAEDTYGCKKAAYKKPAVKKTYEPAPAYDSGY